MKLSKRQKWLRTIIWLKKAFPAQLPTTVCTCKVEEYTLGTTECDDLKFIIEISTGMGIQMRLETLIHEWAHVISWFGAGHKEDHPDDWGLAYARIYRAFLEWEYGVCT